MGKCKKRANENSELEQFDSLPWNPALNDDDPFSLLAGSNNSEGGFLSLEEIDESEFDLAIPKRDTENEKGKSVTSRKSKKRQRVDAFEGRDDDAKVQDEGTTEEEEILKRRRKKKPRTKLKQAREGQDNNSSNVNTSVDDDGEEPVHTAEFYAWNELRLHPLLMKSIYMLGFKEPTPIQKACIPAAAHQGKDVIGAAETGSGKTLAFGLPILQRLLEEQEKAAKLSTENRDAVQKLEAQGILRALIVTPTRELALQVTDHLKEAAKCTNIRVVSIVGGMSTQKQERLLRARPEIIVGTPGRLWELMSGGEHHLVELHSLSFFVLDEADRMIENGHFRELQSIIDMLPTTSSAAEPDAQSMQNCVTFSTFQRKKRQTLVFSATIALSPDFRKKLKRGSLQSKRSMNGDLSSIESLSERAGMRSDAAIVDLTNASIVADKLEESFLDCREEDKDAYLYYILSVHGHGRTIIFCTSVAALRHLSSILRILSVNVCTLHAQMQQRARFKAIDRFRENEHGILVATDVAARGLDISGVRTVVHYQLPHSAEVYVHRSGRTARAFADGCSVALVSPNDRSKFASLCRSFSKETLRRFPVESTYMPEIIRRLSLARQIDKIIRKESQVRAKESWIKRSAESVELVLEDSDSEEERVKNYYHKKASSIHLKKLQQELNKLMARPLQPKSFSHRYLAGAGISPLMQFQLEELVRQQKPCSDTKRKLVVIGQDCMEPLQALRKAGSKVTMDVKELAEKQRNLENLRRKRKEEKKRLREQRRKQRKRLKGITE
ncbi:hypothetical protein Nepgr_030238 [Nepenthes gracilis]|uniref:DEAD-box ATP-dependent RNA helicase 13 n=1 Tax=Nepenthes gracilis TaxID=150966 RepID=A0AAD3Y5L9_NEPGR|nr:hypothetical protein Nepgr_030238 [Nepenthes gracilis]